MNQKLSDWAGVAEIVGAVAVTLSLIFVGLQIRSNTLATQASTFQDSVGYDVEILLAQGRDLETARVYSAFLRDPASLTEDETEQATLLALASLRHMENLYFQHQAGMLSDEAWAARQGLMRFALGSPGFGLLLDNPNAFSGEFLDYAEQVRSGLASGK